MSFIVIFNQGQLFVLDRIYRAFSEFSMKLKNHEGDNQLLSYCIAFIAGLTW